VRAGGKKMKYQVYKHVESLLEIDDFFEVTDKFSKKFYKLSFIKGSPDPPTYYLSVNAVAISRDLIYKIYWEMKAEPINRKLTPKSVRHGDDPIRGWIPSNKDDLTKLYPNVGCVPDEQGEHHWMTIFEANGFVRVDDIQTIE